MAAIAAQTLIRSHAMHGPRLASLIPLLAFACSKEGVRSDVSAKTVANVAAQGDKHSYAREAAEGHSAIECDSLAGFVCYRASAFSHEDPYQSNPVLGSRWIVFGVAGDSLEFFVRPVLRSPQPGGAYITTNYGQEHDSSQNTASRFRHRLLADGVVDVAVDFDNVIGDEIVGDTVAYTLSFRRLPTTASPALRPSGRWATLTLASRRLTDRFSVVPLSVRRSVSDLSKWKVPGLSYQVALVRDSLYEVCQLPCTSPDTVNLTPLATVTKRY